VKLFLLSFVQGVAEFFPVSSSGHLAVLEHLFHIEESYALTIYLHLATLCAIICYLYSDIRESFADKAAVSKIILAFAVTIPVAVVMKRYVFVFSGNLSLVGICFFITAVFLFLSDRRKHTVSVVSFKTALIIGFIQGLAVLPGISRSGVTIAGAILLGVKPDSAFKFSFLLAIPTILGAGIYESGSIRHLLSGAELNVPYFLPFAVAFITGLFSLAIFKKFVQKKKLSFFSFYCCIIGMISLLIGGLKW